MQILLADDHVLVRDVLKSYVERSEPTAVVHTAGTLDEALQVADREPEIGLVILDYRMPGMDGLAGLDRMRAAKPEVPVAMISGVARRDEVHDAIARGAAGFLPKTLSGPALVSAIRLMIAGERFLPATSFDPGEEAVSSRQSETAPTSGQVPFTRRERQVLSHLFEGHSNKEIARALDLQEVTVKLHVRGICRKLGAKNRTQAVLRALDVHLAG